jgi:hypothetical protein
MIAKREGTKPPVRYNAIAHHGPLTSLTKLMVGILKRTRGPQKTNQENARVNPRKI